MSADPYISMPGVPWVEKADTVTGRGCGACRWPMPTNIIFETHIDAVSLPDVVHVRVRAMRFACPGCGRELVCKVGGP